MLVLRPFKVGDFVQIGGVTGTVHELGLFGTSITTPDNVMNLVGPVISVRPYCHIDHYWQVHRDEGVERYPEKHVQREGHARRQA